MNATKLADTLEALERAATKAPWEQRVAGIEGDNYVAGTGPWYRLDAKEARHLADGSLIAALRNSAPLLITALRLAETGEACSAAGIAHARERDIGKKCALMDVWAAAVRADDDARAAYRAARAALAAEEEKA